MNELTIHDLGLPSEAVKKLGGAFRRMLDVINREQRSALSTYRSQLLDDWDSDYLAKAEDKVEWFEADPKKSNDRLLAVWANWVWIDWRRYGDDSITLNLSGNYDDLRQYADWRAFRLLLPKVKEKIELTKKIIEKDGEKEK